MGEALISGIYRCVASNLLGRDELDICFYVTGSDLILKMLKPLTLFHIHIYLILSETHTHSCASRLHPLVFEGSLSSCAKFSQWMWPILTVVMATGWRNEQEPVALIVLPLRVARYLENAGGVRER